MKKVVIGSTSRVKLESVKQAFSIFFPDEKFEFCSIPASSSVSDQPMSCKETLQGAINRAESASRQNADFHVGIEGGVEGNDGLECFAWVVIKSKNYLSKAKTASFHLPPKVAELIKKGMELGKADDIVFSTSDSKHDSGSVGLLTDNVIDRTEYYRHAVILALIPFKKPELYLRKP